LPAGNYTIKLVKGKDVYSTSIELKWPDDSPFSAEEREEQRKLTMSLFTLSEHLAYIYFALDEMMRQAGQIPDKENSLTRKLTGFISSCKSFQTTLVSLEGDGYVNQDEKLREKISDLYRKVSQYPGKPSESQIRLTRALENDMTEVDTKLSGIMDTELMKLNSLLLKKGVGPIKVIPEKEFLEKD